MFEIVLKVLGWLVLLYGIGGAGTALLYFLMGGLDAVSLIVIFLSWPIWLFVYIAGGK